MSELPAWVSSLRENYVPPTVADAGIEQAIAELSPDKVPIKGTIADHLIYSKPQMFPVRVWGGGVGLRSKRRMRRLYELLKVAPGGFPTGEAFLVRFRANCHGWLPHPYNVPSWALDSFERFCYLHRNREAFLICKQWEKENNEAVDAFIKEKMHLFQVQCSASYCGYLDVGILINPPTPELLQTNTIWQHETRLADLVKTLYPDAFREYAPPWLQGQRLDIFVPSINVAFEYQGEQHYEPINIYGGEEGLLNRQRQDQRKRQLCAANGVTLIEWKYTKPLSREILIEELARRGFAS